MTDAQPTLPGTEEERLYPRQVVRFGCGHVMSGPAWGAEKVQPVETLAPCLLCRREEEG